MLQSRKKWLILIPVIVLLFAFISSTFIINANAYCDLEAGCSTDHPASDTTCPLCGHLHNYNAFSWGYQRFLWTMAVNTYGDIINPKNPAPDDGTGAGSDTIGIVDILRFDTNTTFQKVMSAGESVYDMLAIVGAIIVFTYFLLELAEVNMDDGFTYETLTKHVIKTIVGILIIKNGFMILEWALTTCTSIFDTLSTATSGNAISVFTFSGCPFHMCVGANLIDFLGGFFSYAIPYIAILAAMMTVRIICWARLLDITIRVMLAPIGMSDLIKGGMNSGGVRYLKKLCASSLQGACILAVMAAYRAIAASIYATSTGVFASIVVALALVTAVKKTGAIAEDVLGLG